jgi:hypothetical protein
LVVDGFTTVVLPALYDPLLEGGLLELVPELLVAPPPHAARASAATAAPAARAKVLRLLISLMGSAVLLSCSLFVRGVSGKGGLRTALS